MTFPHAARVGGVDRATLRAELTKAAVHLNPLAEELLADDRFLTAAEPSWVPIVARTPRALGFPSGATFDAVVAAAVGQGLSLCPLELGPHLRLQHMGQEESPSGAPTIAGKAPPGALTIASLPPPDEEPIPWGFYLRRVGDQRWLRGYRSWSGHFWSPEDPFVFLRATSGP